MGLEPDNYLMYQRSENTWKKTVNSKDQNLIEVINNDSGISHKWLKRIQHIIVKVPPENSTNELDRKREQRETAENRGIHRIWNVAKTNTEVTVI